MRVKATAKGSYGGLRAVGEIFTLAEKTPPDGTVVTVQDQFSPRWMVPVDADGNETDVAAKPKAAKTKAAKPKAEEPKAEEPKAEEPKAEEPKAEEPKAEEPKAEEPKVEEPKVEEPKARRRRRRG